MLLALPKRRGDEVDNSRSVGMGLHPVGLQFSNKCDCWPMGHVGPRGENSRPMGTCDIYSLLKKKRCAIYTHYIISRMLLIIYRSSI